MKKFYSSLALFGTFLVAVFLLHLSWEVGHSLLYSWNPSIDFYIPFISFVALKDALWSLVFYFVAALLLHDTKWPRDKKVGYWIAAACGFLFAVIIEKHALATGRWQYNSLMPIIPFLHTGLAPILQMSLIPSVAVFISEKIFSR